jgi:hypothetical protein
VHGLATVRTIWDPNAWPYLIGLVLVAFAPFAVFGLFTFVGATAADAIGSRIGSHAASAGTRSARAVVAIPSRLSAHAARTPSARMSTTTGARPAHARPASGVPASRPSQRLSGRTIPSQSATRSKGTPTTGVRDSSSATTSAPARTASAPSGTRHGQPGPNTGHQGGNP